MIEKEILLKLKLGTNYIVKGEVLGLTVSQCVFFRSSLVKFYEKLYQKPSVLKYMRGLVLSVQLNMFILIC